MLKVYGLSFVVLFFISSYSVAEVTEGDVIGDWVCQLEEGIEQDWANSSEYSEIDATWRFRDDGIANLCDIVPYRLSGRAFEAVACAELTWKFEDSAQTISVSDHTLFLRAGIIAGKRVSSDALPEAIQSDFPVRLTGQSYGVSFSAEGRARSDWLIIGKAYCIKQ